LLVSLFALCRKQRYGYPIGKMFEGSASCVFYVHRVRDGNKVGTLLLHAQPCFEGFLESLHLLIPASKTAVDLLDGRTDRPDRLEGVFRVRRKRPNLGGQIIAHIPGFGEGQSGIIDVFPRHFIFSGFVFLDELPAVHLFLRGGVGSTLLVEFVDNGFPYIGAFVGRQILPWTARPSLGSCIG